MPPAPFEPGTQAYETTPAAELDGVRWEAGAAPFEPHTPEPVPYRQPPPSPPPSLAEAPPPVEPLPPAEAPPKRPGLLRPTAKLASALVAAIAAAAGMGLLIGLPMPGGDTQGGSTELASGAVPIGLDLGTSAAPSGGPYFPVLGPVDYGQADAHFGPRAGGFHPGQDMLTKPGTPLIAVRSGTIVDRGTVKGPYSGGRGNYLAIWAPQDQRSYVYLHMLHPSPLRVGDTVSAGQYVGQVGCTGSCDGPHLHFEIRLGKASLHNVPKPIDPLPYLRHWGHAPTAALSGLPSGVKLRDRQPGQP